MCSYEILIVNKYDNHTRQLYSVQERRGENGRIFLAFLRHCILNYTLNTTIVILWFSKRQKTGSHFIETEWSTVIKRPRLKRDRDFIQHCKVGASFRKTSYTWRWFLSYTKNRTIVHYEDINTALLNDIVRGEERDARGKKSAIAKQSTEMTLYLHDISPS